MHVHVPKPLHGWREFFGEVGIIVVGVLIAIGAEQAVEAWHWHEVVSSEREVLDQDVADQWESMVGRADMQPCVDARLTEIGTVLARHDAGKPLGRLGPVGRPMYFGNQSAVWQMAVADQSFAHMSVAMRRRYTAVQGSVAIFDQTTDAEKPAWLALQQINHADHLSPTAWDDVRKAYDAAVDANAVLERALVTNAKTEWLSAFDGFTLKAHPQSLRGVGAVKDLCRPMILG